MSAFRLHGLFWSWWMVFHNTFMFSYRLKKWKAITLLIKIPGIYCIELEMNSFWFNCPSFKMSVSNLCKMYVWKRWWVLTRDPKSELRNEERKEKMQLISAREESPGFVFWFAVPCLSQTCNSHKVLQNKVWQCCPRDNCEFSFPKSRLEEPVTFEQAAVTHNMIVMKK